MSAPSTGTRETYHRVADPQEEWGREVLARLELAGDETVLDAGCGSGRVTRQLLERLPDGRVIGVDALAVDDRARRARTLADDDRVELIVADLLELELDEPVDAIFSNATFHWILDHERLFERLFAALRPGGAARGAVRRAGATSPSGSARSRRCRATSASPPTCAGCRGT